MTDTPMPRIPLTRLPVRGALDLPLVAARVNEVLIVYTNLKERLTLDLAISREVALRLSPYHPPTGRASNEVQASRWLLAHDPRTRQRIGDDASHTLNGVSTDSGPWDDPGLPEDQEAPDSRCRVNKPPHRFLRHTAGASGPVAGGVQQTNASVMAPSEGPPPGGERTGPSRAPWRGQVFGRSDEDTEGRKTVALGDLSH
jgi:hypothetical protein